jgi:hypothetical protein
MMTSSAAKRRRSAYAAAAAAKERRKKILAIVVFVVFIGIMAYEIPHTLKLIKHPSVVAAPVPPPAPAPVKPHVIPKTLRSGAPSDPFADVALVSNDPGVQPSPGGRDPFASTAAQAASTTSAPPAQPLPETIVIGTPTGSGAAVHGWIVILASIPTARGQASALGFARSARRNGIGSVDVLNSSNRRPLRGGYWVVYTGPVKTVSSAEQVASSVHSSGYRGAYVRELIEYR